MSNGGGSRFGVQGDEKDVLRAAAMLGGEPARRAAMQGCEEREDTDPKTQKTRHVRLQARATSHDVTN